MGKSSLILDDIEKQVRSGKTELLEMFLANRPRLSQAESLKLANLARRGGCYGDALKILAPLVKVAGAEEKVIVEYAMILNALGLSEESGEILRGVTSPESVMFQVHRAFSSWDYKEAASLLERYNRFSGISHYESAVANTNLAAAYVAVDDLQQGVPLAQQTLESLEESWHRLAANLNEILAQAAIARNDFTLATDYLDSSKALQVEDPLFDSLFVRKWHAVILSRQAGHTEPLESVEKEAIQRGMWETLRSVGYQKLKVRFDQVELDRLFYGTPYPAFKERLVAEFGQPSEKFFYPKKTSDFIDLSTGFDSSGKQVLDRSSTSLRLFSTLLSDLFRPLKIGHLYSMLYPEESFDFESSPNRVRQALQRLRRNIQDLPLTIKEDDACYSINCQEGFSVAISQINYVEKEELEIERISQIFSGFFSAKEAESALSRSRSSIQRLLKSGVDSGRIEAIGTGRGRKYRILQ